jgi:hypothetical protein
LGWLFASDLHKLLVWYEFEGGMHTYYPDFIVIQPGHGMPEPVRNEMGYQ